MGADGHLEQGTPEISTSLEHSDAVMTRFGGNTSAIVLCGTGARDASRLVERINPRLQDLGLACSKLDSLSIATRASRSDSVRNSRPPVLEGSQDLPHALLLLPKSLPADVW